MELTIQQNKTVCKVTSEAEATIRFAILNALAETALATRLTATSGEILVTALFEHIFSPALIWAVEEYLEERKI